MKEHIFYRLENIDNYILEANAALHSNNLDIQNGFIDGVKWGIEYADKYAVEMFHVMYDRGLIKRNRIFYNRLVHFYKWLNKLDHKMLSDKKLKNVLDLYYHHLRLTTDFEKEIDGFNDIPDYKSKINEWGN